MKILIYCYIELLSQPLLTSAPLPRIRRLQREDLFF